MDVRASSRAPAACAEFPNDNPALHGGAIWRSTEVVGTLSCVVPVRVLVVETVVEPGATRTGPVDLVAFEAIETLEPRDEAGNDDAAIEIVDDLDFSDLDIEDGPSTLPGDVTPSDTQADDPFARLVDVLREAARALGADDRSLLCLRALFGLARADAIAPAEHATEALVAGQVLVRGAKGLARANEFTGKVLAWQGVLRGESEDFSALGPLEPLDEWAADVVARVIGNPARADGIRRELRRRGVAAFGIVADAA
jgi:hypothetical protein